MKDKPDSERVSRKIKAKQNELNNYTQLLVILMKAINNPTKENTDAAIQEAKRQHVLPTKMLDIADLCQLNDSLIEKMSKLRSSIHALAPTFISTKR